MKYEIEPLKSVNIQLYKYAALTDHPIRTFRITETALSTGLSGRKKEGRAIKKSMTITQPY